MPSSEVLKLRSLVKKLAKHHCVAPSSVKMTRVPFFNYMAFMLAKYPTKSICDVAVRAGKCWRRMEYVHKKPYCIIAQIVQNTALRA